MRIAYIWHKMVPKIGCISEIKEKSIFSWYFTRFSLSLRSVTADCDALEANHL